MLGETMGGLLAGGVGLIAYAVRGRSATWLAPSVWRGPRESRSIALTFDDGPSEATPRVLAVLADFGVRATFFQCGASVRRLPGIARDVLRAGHEIGNHSDTHAMLCFRTPGGIRDELFRAQQTIAGVTGSRPTLFRAPYGVRWFGLRGAQQELGLQGVMWTVLGLDWKLDGDAVFRRLLKRTGPGAIICLHDGRRLDPNPDIQPTLDAIQRFIPAMLERGYYFQTTTELIFGKNRGPAAV